MSKKTSDAHAPKTPEAMAKLATRIADISKTMPPLLAQYGEGLANNIVEHSAAVAQFVAAGKREDTAKQYVSSAIAIYAACGISAAFRKELNTLGRDVAYAWAREIVAADKAGKKSPTLAAHRKAAKARSEQRAAARAERAAENRKQAGDTKSPETVAEVTAIINPMVEKAAAASGDPALFLRNLAQYYVNAAETYEAAEARAAEAKASA